MAKNKKITFLGGDLRQFYMAEELASLGYDIAVYGLEMVKEIEGINKPSSLYDAMEFAEIIVCPVPFSRDNINILSNNFKEDLSIENFISYIKAGQKIFGGNINPNIINGCKEKEVIFYDFMKDEKVTIKNAISTAEGTIAETIKNSHTNLHKSRCLIIGFGRCAKVLADKLKGLNATVTIAARNEEQLTVAETCGYNTVPLGLFYQELKKADFIFNTVPAKILDREALNFIKNGSIIIDIASMPGGTDFERCKELNIPAFLCLGLPGKYSPKSSAKILNEVILEFK